MPVFPSDEWMRQFCARLEADPEVEDLAEGLSGVYRFVIEPGGPLRERVTYDVQVSEDDTGASVTLCAAPAAAPRFTMATDYRRWRQLIQGELDVGMALLLRRVRVSGDYGALLRKGTVRPLVHALHGVDSHWLDEGA